MTRRASRPSMSTSVVGRRDPRRPSPDSGPAGRYNARARQFRHGVTPPCPLHDPVDPCTIAGIFRRFNHVAWNPEIQGVLNGGLLPEGYYALAEQHAGRAIADVLDELHAKARHNLEATAAELRPPLPPATGGVALADAPPRERGFLAPSTPSKPGIGREGRNYRIRSPLIAILEATSVVPPPRRPHRDRLAGEQGPARVTSRTSSTRPSPPWISACILAMGWWTCFPPESPP